MTTPFSISLFFNPLKINSTQAYITYHRNYFKM